MTKVVVAMSVSLYGIAGREAADEDGMALFGEILGLAVPAAELARAAGPGGAEDSVDSRVWQENFDRFGPQVIGMADVRLRVLELREGVLQAHPWPTARDKAF